MKSGNRQTVSIVSPVLRYGGTKQGTEAHSGVEASIWTERMLAALENGVRGGKWFSLIHKRWPNAFFAELGLFTMTEAHALACQSRC
jgi:hypothetical protein